MTFKRILMTMFSVEYYVLWKVLLLLICLCAIPGYRLSSASTETYSFSKTPSPSRSMYNIIPDASYTALPLLACLWTCASDHSSLYTVHSTVSNTCTCACSITPATSMATQTEEDHLYYITGCDPQAGFTAYTDGNLTLCFHVGNDLVNYTDARTFCGNLGSRMFMPDTR